MDRHGRLLAGGCLAVIMGMFVAVAGCRSMRNDVPPGKPYSTTGGSPPPVGFNSDPHPNTAIGRLACMAATALLRPRQAQRGRVHLPNLEHHRPMRALLARHRPIGTVHFPGT